MLRPSAATAIAISILVGSACARQDPGIASAPPALVPGSMNFASTKDNFSMVLPMNMQPIDSDSPEAKEMMDAAAKANPQLAKQIAKITAAGTFALYAMDIPQMKKGAALVDNVNVIHRTNSPAPPMEDSSVQNLRKFILAQLPGAKIIAGEIVDLPVGKAIRIVSEMPLQTAGGSKITSRSEGYYLGDRNHFYVVTFTSGSDARSIEFRRSMDSFRIQ